MAGILVCDDDQEIVEAIEIYLKQEGYQVYQAHDGMEALKILKEQPALSRPRTITADREFHPALKTSPLFNCLEDCSTQRRGRQSPFRFFKYSSTF